jgi:DNA-binding transcriptional LysR family regulator
LIEQIESFVAVVETRGFSQAARRLSLPKSTVSHRVQQLEARLRVRLLQRTSRTVRATDEGLAYYQHCVRILAEIAEAEQALGRDQAMPTGTLRLSVPIEFGMQVLGGVLAEFIKTYPTVRMKVELTSRNVDLIEEGVDLAVRIGALADSSLVARRVLSIPRSLYASPAYLAARDRPETPDALGGHSCLRFETAFYQGTWGLIGPRGRVSFEPSGAIHANNLTVLRDAAIAGLGIALLPCYQCRQAERDGRLERLMPDWPPEPADVFILYPSKRHLSVKVQAFLSFLDRHKEALETAVQDAPIEPVRRERRHSQVRAQVRAHKSAHRSRR